ncbi:MAG: uridylate kinase [Methylovulum sp.]|nr:uridylate kinase [Methylovulum sp.]
MTTLIKLGGSLAQSDNLRDCLETIGRRYQGKAVVIVPGGGAFADQVRLAQHHWQFDDRTAHAMALLAMQQMALLFNGLKPGFVVAGSVAQIREHLAQAKTVVWSPAITELDQAGIAASWDITSDSLAAWLAGVLSATELVLVKSAGIDTNLSLPQLAEQAIVDKAFCTSVTDAAFSIKIINAQHFNDRT